MKSSIITATSFTPVKLLNLYIVIVDESGSRTAPGMLLYTLEHSVLTAHLHQIVSLSGSMTVKEYCISGLAVNKIWQTYNLWY